MKILSSIFLIFLASCTIAPRISVTTTAPEHSVIIDGKLFATAWQQKSAEYRALCYQAYNTARQRVEESKDIKTEKPKAIMTDIDETVLDNSKYQAHQVLQGKDYDATSWYEWTAMASADTVPGALHFLQYAAASGIEIFYVTNRKEEERGGTLKNLLKFNFPNADNEHLLLKQNTSSKESRRESILASHSIILFIGDNLNDLSRLFEKKSPDERMAVTDALSDKFGNKFIVLPNPVYGDWESSLYHFNHSLTPAQKDSVIKSSLFTY